MSDLLRLADQLFVRASGRDEYRRLSDLHLVPTVKGAVFGGSFGRAPLQ
jgi:hypothetical protein